MFPIEPSGCSGAGSKPNGAGLVSPSSTITVKLLAVVKVEPSGPLPTVTVYSPSGKPSKLYSPSVLVIVVCVVPSGKVTVTVTPAKPSSPGS